MTPNQKSSFINPRSRRASGFTLIEAALTLVIVGTGILAMVSAQQAYHIKNDWAQRTGTAQMLANELRELTLTLPQSDPITGTATIGAESNESGGLVDWDDLDDFAGDPADISGGIGPGRSFNPPVNALRTTIDGLDNWTQVIEVENVFPDNLSAADTQPLGTTDMMRVTVTIQYKDASMAKKENITSMSWVVTQ